MIYIETRSTNPYYNFALEYYLMKEKNLPYKQILLFWRTEPTVMIGRYQNTIEEINEKYVRANNIQVVRRITGGGTVYTDMGGWQFSMINRGNKKEIDFKQYLTPIIEALNNLGVKAEFNSRNDLVIGDKKISGNAQGMYNGYTLHHGTLLFDSDLEQLVRCLNVDDEKIISKGIKSVKDRVTNISKHLQNSMESLEFKELMISNLTGKNNTSQDISSHEDDKEYLLTDEDINRIEEITKEKFQDWDWNYGKSPKFNIVKGARFDGGKVEFKLDVNNGIIESCNIYGDFFTGMDIEKICLKLIGVRYDKDDILQRLKEEDMERGFHNIDLQQMVKEIF